jgi:hypothetical protein
MSHSLAAARFGLFLSLHADYRLGPIISGGPSLVARRQPANRKGRTLLTRAAAVPFSKRITHTIAVLQFHCTLLWLWPAVFEDLGIGLQNWQNEMKRFSDLSSVSAT